MRTALCAVMALLALSSNARAINESEWDSDGRTLWMKLPCMISRNLDAQVWEFATDGVLVIRSMDDGAYAYAGNDEAYRVFINICGLPSNIPEGLRPDWMSF